MTGPADVDPDETAPLEPLDIPPVPRVNLLPPEVVQVRRQRRVAGVSAGLLVVYLIVLGGLYASKVAQVADARDARDALQIEVAALEAEVDELAAYQQLVNDIEVHETLLSSAMADELSWARIFGELALSFNRGASLVELQAVTAEPVAGEQTPSDAAEAGTAAGQITFTGYSIERVAPGVQAVLEEVVEGEGLFDSYLITAAEQQRGDEEVTGFEGRVELGADAYTHRYDDGLPQESIQ